MASLAEIRARIAAQENKSGSNNGSTKQSDNSIYPPLEYGRRHNSVNSFPTRRR